MNSQELEEVFCGESEWGAATCAGEHSWHGEFSEMRVTFGREGCTYLHVAVSCWVYSAGAVCTRNIFKAQPLVFLFFIAEKVWCLLLCVVHFSPNFTALLDTVTCWRSIIYCLAGHRDCAVVTWKTRWRQRWQLWALKHELRYPLTWEVRTVKQHHKLLK